MQNGKKQEAFDTYQKVLSTDPDNVMARLSLASYYDEIGEKELYKLQLDSLLLNKKIPSEAKLNVMRQVIAQNEQAGADSTQAQPRSNSAVMCALSGRTEENISFRRAISLLWLFRMTCRS